LETSLNRPIVGYCSLANGLADHLASVTETCAAFTFLKKKQATTTNGGLFPDNTGALIAKAST
jgi:hypothetical protein